MQANSKKALDDKKINIKFVLAGLWIVLMILFLYADVFSLYRTGQIEKMISGYMGPFIVSQNSLLLSSILMAIPALMIIISLTIKSNINRYINIVVGFLYILVEIGNMIGETWIYYLFYGALELAITIIIIINSIKWPKNED